MYKCVYVCMSVPAPATVNVRGIFGVLFLDCTICAHYIILPIPSPLIDPLSCNRFPLTFHSLLSSLLSPPFSLC